MSSIPDPAAERRAVKAPKQTRCPAGSPPGEGDLNRLRHDLEVHQVELESQNANLRVTQAKLEDALRRYTDFYDCGPMPYLSLKPDGEIRQLNHAAATLLGAERSQLVNRRLGQFVRLEDRAALAGFLEKVFEGQGQACEVTLSEGLVAPVMVRIEAVRGASGQECQAVMINITERKKAEEALRHSEVRRALAMDAAEAGTWEWELATGKNVWSEQLWKLYGLAPDSSDSCYEAWCQVIHPEDRDQIERTVAEAVRTEGEVNLEWRVRKPDGSDRWLMSRGRPLRDEGGRMTRYIGVVWDVTERKRTEQEVREGKLRLDQLAEQSRTIAWEVNAAGLFTYVSHVVEIVLGYHPEELVGRRHFYDLHPEIGREEFKEAAFAVFARKEPFMDLLNAVVTKDGCVRWVSTNGIPLLNPDGTLRGYRGSDTDFTERKRAEDEVRRQTALISSLLDSIPDLVFFKNTEGVYLGCNPGFAEFVGRPRSEIIGKTDHDLFEKEIADGFREHDQRMLAKGEPRHNEEWITYPDGRRSLLDTLKTPYWGPDGELIGVLGLSRDITESKAAELKLWHERQRLANIIEGTRAGTWEWNVQTGESVISELWARIVGYTVEELAPVSLKTWEGLAHPEDMILARAVMDRHIAGGLDFCETQVRMKHKDGRWVWMYNRGQIVTRSADGRPLMVYGTSTDMTQLKLAEDRILQLSRAVEQSPASTMITNLAGNIEYVNPRFTELTGYTAAEVMGKNPRFLKSGETSLETYRELWQTITAGKTWRGDFLNRKRNGELYWENVNITPIVDSSGRISHFLSVKEDITRRLQTEAALRESEHYARATLNAITGHLAVLDRNGIIIGVNRPWREFAEANAGNPAAVCEGANYLAVCDTAAKAGCADAAAFAAGLRSLLDGAEGVFTLEHTCDFPDESRWFVSKVTRFPGEGNARVTVVHEDITSIRQAHERLRQTNLSLEAANARATALAERANEANRAKSEFLAMMSHEIRTPMNAVLGMTRLLLDTPLDTRQTEFARTVATSGEALLDIINDILDLSKIEAGGQLQMDEKPFSIRGLAGSLMQLLQPRARDRGLSLEADLAEDIPDRVKGDAGRLRQVLMNLVGNGIKFTDRGAVQIRMRLLGAEGPRFRLRFEVQDTGIGISAEDAARLFQPFTQVDSSAARHRGGTGLGLVISRRIVELMGGSMGLESAPGQGSLFWFEITLEVDQSLPSQDKPPVEGHREPAVLPGTENEGRRSPAALPGGVAPGRPLRILVAEDHEPNRRLAMYMLESLNHRPDFANNGREAVEAWERSPYDIIIMDCQMPGMDGFQATQEIRKREAARSGGDRTYIIALTANAVKGDRERCLAAGMDGYLSKPYTAQQLGAALSQHPAPSAPPRSTLHARPAPPAPPAPPATFDPQLPAQLCADLGREGVCAIVEDYLAELPGQVTEIGVLSKAGRRSEAGRLAHSLRGISLSFGLVGFGSHLWEIEELAEGAEDARLWRLLELLPGEAERAGAELRRWMRDA